MTARQRKPPKNLYARIPLAQLSQTAAPFLTLVASAVRLRRAARARDAPDLRTFVEKEAHHHGRPVEVVRTRLAFWAS